VQNKKESELRRRQGSWQLKPLASTNLPFPSKGANNSISRDKIDERYPKNPKK
jgi:hypothetical protein